MLSEAEPISNQYYVEYSSTWEFFQYLYSVRGRHYMIMNQVFSDLLENRLKATEDRDFCRWFFGCTDDIQIVVQYRIAVNYLRRGLSDRLAVHNRFNGKSVQRSPGKSPVGRPHQVAGTGKYKSICPICHSIRFPRAMHPNWRFRRLHSQN